ncbi:MAG: helix-turn-helix transcriptional regulator [Mycoplasmatota bacterium]
MNDIKIVISENINKYLKEKNMKKNDLAIKLNIHKTSVGAWCSGSAAPAISIIPLLCEVLDITINQLFSMSTDKTISAEEFMMLERFRSVSLAKQNIIIELLKE